MREHENELSRINDNRLGILIEFIQQINSGLFGDERNKKRNSS